MRREKKSLFDLDDGDGALGGHLGGVLERDARGVGELERAARGRGDGDGGGRGGAEDGGEALGGVLVAVEGADHDAALAVVVLEDEPHVALGDDLLREHGEEDEGEAEVVRRAEVVGGVDEEAAEGREDDAADGEHELVDADGAAAALDRVGHAREVREADKEAEEHGGDDEAVRVVDLGDEHARDGREHLVAVDEPAVVAPALPHRAREAHAHLREVDDRHEDPEEHLRRLLAEREVDVAVRDQLDELVPDRHRHRVAREVHHPAQVQKHAVAVRHPLALAPLVRVLVVPQRRRRRRRRGRARAHACRGRRGRAHHRGRHRHHRITLFCALLCTCAQAGGRARARALGALLRLGLLLALDDRDLAVPVRVGVCAAVLLCGLLEAALLRLLGQHPDGHDDEQGREEDHHDREGPRRAENALEHAAKDKAQRLAKRVADAEDRRVAVLVLLVLAPKRLDDQRPEHRVAQPNAHDRQEQPPDVRRVHRHNAAKQKHHDRNAHRDPRPHRLGNPRARRNRHQRIHNRRHRLQQPQRRRRRVHVVPNQRHKNPVKVRREVLDEPRHAVPVEVGTQALAKLRLGVVHVTLFAAHCLLCFSSVPREKDLRGKLALVSLVATKNNFVSSDKPDFTFNTQSG